MLSLGYDALSIKTMVQVALDKGGVFIKEVLALLWHDQGTL
jgi:hypothetical protein